jgi:hypothetical protein
VSKVIAALVAVVGGIALAVGGTATLVNLASPDRSVNLENAPAANGEDGPVDYGTSGK